MERFELEVGESFHRRRLDEFLFHTFRNYSKAYLREVVKRGLCEINGYSANAGIELRRDDFVEVLIDPVRSKAMVPALMDLDVVYEDADLIVIDKAPGVLVHPTHFERDGTLLNGLSHYLNQNQTDSSEFIRPHLVHRLDRETSGLIVVATNSDASRRLCRQIKKKKLQKRYLALVRGRVTQEKGEIEAPIIRDPELKQHLVRSDGKPSVSRYRVSGRFADTTLLELEPVTGRTNQLRIHCAEIGHPIVGDRLYSDSKTDRLCLHASRLEFWHPTTNEKLHFDSDRPDFLKELGVFRESAS